MEELRQILDATDTDLSAFKRRGGKLLMYFGWADPQLNPLMGVEYYEQVTEKMGPSDQRFRPLVYGAGHVPLRRRRRDGRVRYSDPARQVGGSKRGSGPDRGQPRGGGQGCPDEAVVSLPTNCALQRRRKHRRLGQLHLRKAIVGQGFALPLAFPPAKPRAPPHRHKVIDLP